MIRSLIIILLFISAFLYSCREPNPIEEEIPPSEEDIISENFVGIGPEIGGYDNIKAWTGSSTLNDEDWNKVFLRLSFMRPGLVRAMGSEGWNYSLNGEYNPEKSSHILFKMLDYCQENNINIVWGEWGHKGDNDIDMEWLERSINFLDFLINTKGYSCIKYFNMVNEPNGNWSSINGNYSLWRNLINRTYELIISRGLSDKVEILGPDVAISRNAFTGSTTVSNSFISNSVYDFVDRSKSYGLHFYPGSNQMGNDKFFKTVSAYRNLFPASRDVLVSELGFKYHPDSPKGEINQLLINSDPYAASNANMMVYESIYGIDMAAAIIQLLSAGYKGVVVWRMDDAMYTYNDASSLKLTRWGFWNIIGEEYCNNPKDEELRPWFYTTSLLSRYFPSGCTILNVLSDKKGVYAVGAKKDGKYTIAVVNTHTNKQTVNIKLGGGTEIIETKIYKYSSLDHGDFIGEVDSNGFPKVSEIQDVDFSNGKSYEIHLNASSFILLTNMD